MRRRTVLTTILSLTMFALLFSGCGDEDTEKAADTSAPTTVSDGDKGKIVQAELGEDGANFFVKSDPDSVDAGKVTFAITNVGKLYHEFIVYTNEDGVKATDLPIKDNIADLDEEKIIGEATYATPPIVPEDKKPGDADHRIRPEGWGAEMTVDLDPGKYILLCNLDGHYATGQATDLEVK